MNRMIPALAHRTALIGGAVLLALVAMTCVSVLGRAGLTLSALTDPAGFLSDLRPVRGDYELIEIGSAIAIFAFLPQCLVARGHARVDLTRGWLSPCVDWILDRLWDWLMVAAMAVILWQLWLGMLGKRVSAETTFLLQLPLWWAYAICVGFAAISALTALWLAIAPARQGAALAGHAE